MVKVRYDAKETATNKARYEASPSIEIESKAKAKYCVYDVNRY